MPGPTQLDPVRDGSGSTKNLGKASLGSNQTYPRSTPSPSLCLALLLGAGSSFLLLICVSMSARSITMASESNSSGKKLIQIDVSSDTVCPWCFVGKKNLDKAIALSSDRYTFEIKWHPYILIHSAPKEGIAKKELIRKKLGPRAEQLEAGMAEVFKSLGMDYDTSGLTGSTLDSHRLIYLAGTQGLDKQHKLVEEICFGYFTQGKYIGDREFLVEAAKKVGVEGAAEFLKDPNNGLKEVNEEIKKYSAHINGVPYYVINGKHQLNGGQPPETFLRTFEVAAAD